MIYGGISDCDMEKGQLRCDANISIRPVGAGGARHQGRAEEPQLHLLRARRHRPRDQAPDRRRAAGGTIVQETRDYDGQTGASQSLRSKEMAHDYRYFPDPDLMPVQVDEAWKARAPRRMPRAALRQAAAVSRRSTRFPTRSPRCSCRTAELSDYFEEAAQALRETAGGRQLDRQRPAARARRGQGSPWRSPRCAPRTSRRWCSWSRRRDPEQRREGGFRRHVPDGRDARGHRGEEGPRRPQTNPGELERWCREAIAANPKSLADFKGGKADRSAIDEVLPALA